jgi:RNA polymerase sigma-70 factor (ECF subfamily)
LLRADSGKARGARHTTVIRGAQAVASQAMRSTPLAQFVRPARVNGAAGAVVVAGGRALTVMGFTLVDGRIVGFDVLSDPKRLADLDLTAFEVSS